MPDHPPPLLEAVIPGRRLHDRGKIRDVFAAGEDILVVTTDRVYLFDRVYPAGLPGKGRVLTALTLKTFAAVRDLVPNYVLTSRVEDYPPPFNYLPELLAGRSYLTRKVEPVRLECVARGYLYGQAWEAYRKGGASWLPPLPAGLKQASKLTRPVFTPARKSRFGEDRNLTRGELVELVGESRADEIERITLEIYRRMREVFARGGFILADTKFEFGERDGRLLLINEACTPDCSRIWKEELHRPGRLQDPWDKEILENYLREKGWSPPADPLPLPPPLLAETRRRFADLLPISGAG